jgi:hypothetical protein
VGLADPLAATLRKPGLSWVSQLVAQSDLAPRLMATSSSDMVRDMQLRELRDRVEHLEKALLLLARHVGAVGWNHDLQKALDLIREATS